MTMLSPARSGKLLAASALGLLMCCAFAPKEAQAGLSLGVELGPTFLLDPPADSTVGFSFAGRAGYKLGLPLISLTPEIKVSFDTVQEAKGYRAMAGARLSIGALLSPNAFIHGGYGSLEGDFKGFAMDAGVGLDFTLIPVIDIGVLLSYNRITDDGFKVHWLQVGAQATLSF
jgi:hypothetical protein